MSTKAGSESLLPCVSIKRKGSTSVVETIFTIKKAVGALKRALRRAIKTTNYFYCYAR